MLATCNKEVLSNLIYLTPIYLIQLVVMPLDSKSHKLLSGSKSGILLMRKLATAAEVFKELEPVMDPEHPVSITDPQMQIVKEEYIEVGDGTIKVSFKPTVPYCPMGGLIGVLIRNRLEAVYPGSRIEVSVLPGTHSLESQVNEMINNDTKYHQIIQQMKERGMI
jgi:metal-sulfur cluster biosynthetic enzyme